MSDTELSAVVEDLEPGHSKIQDDQTVPSDARTAVIERAVSDWIARHPNLTVKNMVPIVAHGVTVAVHIWWTD
jgi:hypothetical protein